MVQPNLRFTVNVLAAAVLSGLAAISIPGTAEATRFVSYLKPYIGAEYNYMSLKGKESWDDIFPTSYNSVKLLLGSRFNKYLGVELGYARSAKRDRFANFVAGQSVLGSTVPAGGINNIRMKSRTSNWDLDLNGYYPLMNQVDLMATVGVARKRAELDGSETPQIAGTTIDESVRNATAKRKYIYRLGFGGEYTENSFVLRGRLLWENTSRLRLQSEGLGANAPTKAFQNGFGVSLGVHYKFM